MLSDPANLCATCAVIPFTALQSEPNQLVLGDLLTDELNAALSVAPQLKVISRLSVARLPREGTPIEQARRLLGADYVITGTFACEGPVVTVRAELFDIAGGAAIWSGEACDEIRAILQGKDHLTAELVAAARASILGCETRRVRSSSLGTLHAYSLLFGAIGLMHRFERSGFERAGAALAQLTSSQKMHPLPHAWMAHWHGLKVGQGWSDDYAKELQLASESSSRALERESESALALTMDGFVRTHRKDLDGGLRQFDAALQVNPSEPMAWLLKGALHAFRGEGAAAIAATTRAASLSPLDPLSDFYDSLAATANFSAGRYEAGRLLALRALRANPCNVSSLRTLAGCQVQLGQLVQARKSVVRLRALSPDLTVRRYLQTHPGAAYPVGILVAQSLHAAGLPD